MSKTYRISAKHVGIAGINCPCCRRFATVKGTRIALNRADRRATRQALRQI